MEPNIQNRDNPSSDLHYEMLPHDPDVDVTEIPMFLLAVCLLLRCHVMGYCISVALAPRWMGVPGTQLGLRAQLRTVLTVCGAVSSKELARVYVDQLPKLMLM